MIYKSYLIEQNINLIKDNLILFYGENLGLKNSFKDKIKQINKKAFVKNIIQQDILANEEHFFNEVLNNSLFGEKKIYFINQANDKILEIVKQIESKISDQELYFFSETLDKKSKLRSYFEKSNVCSVVACYPDNEITIKKIILDRLKNYKGLTTQNLNIIIENCQLDRNKLNNELDKIITFFEDKLIEKDKLELLLNIKENDNFSNLKDEVLKGNKSKTNELINDTVLDLDKNILYLSLINQRLQRLSELNSITNSASMEDKVSELKPPIFWKDKPAFIMQSKKWNPKKIEKALNKTYDFELKMKSNSFINQNLLLKKLLVDICVLASV